MSKKYNNYDLEEVEISTREKVFEFIVNYITQNGYSPSIKEICEGTNLSSKAGVFYQLNMLEFMGKIHVEKNKPRAIRIKGYAFVKVG